MLVDIVGDVFIGLYYRIKHQVINSFIAMLRYPVGQNIGNGVDRYPGGDITIALSTHSIGDNYEMVADEIVILILVVISAFRSCVMD